MLAQGCADKLVDGLLARQSLGWRGFLVHLDVPVADVHFMDPNTFRCFLASFARIVTHL